MSAACICEPQSDLIFERPFGFVRRPITMSSSRSLWSEIPGALLSNSRSSTIDLSAVTVLMALNDTTVFGDYSELHMPNANAAADDVQKQPFSDSYRHQR